MSLLGLSVKNIRRNRFRTFSTIAGVAVTVVAFILLRTVLWAWGAAAEYGAKDRVATRHKVTFVMQLPLRYFEEIKQVPGVTAATYMNWFGAKYPAAEQEFFATFAVDAKSVLEVYDELSVPADQKAAFLSDRQGALVGDVLASKFGWKVGDTVTLQGTIYPGDWKFTVRGIYSATRKSVDRSSFYFHWAYMNDTLPEGRKDLIGWVAARIDDPAKAADIAKAIDDRFADRDVQTLSMSEQAMNASFMGMMSAILGAVDVVSLVILAIMGLILGNTISMGVRERTREYGVLRALGFESDQIAWLILGEAAFIGLLGGLVGLALAYPMVDRGMGQFLENNMGAWFPYFRVQPGTALVALGLAVALAFLAALIPALRASRQDVVTSLRRVG